MIHKLFNFNNVQTQATQAMGIMINWGKLHFSIFINSLTRKKETYLSSICCPLSFIGDYSQVIHGKVFFDFVLKNVK